MIDVGNGNGKVGGNYVSLVRLGFWTVAAADADSLAESRTGYIVRVRARIAGIKPTLPIHDQRD